MNVQEWVRDELRDLAFSCLEECGFCCTFTPEVSAVELQRLKAGYPTLKVVREGDRMHLPFQGGCGACTLLVRRRCTAYDERPAHCRYFPFHVYFGARTSVYVNRSCRGVESRPGATLEDAFTSSVVAVASPALILEQQRRARKVQTQFRAHAVEAGVWGDARQVAMDLLADPTTTQVRSGDGDTWADALRPFAGSNPVERPYYLDAALRWMTVEVEGDTFQPVAMGEDGTFLKIGDPFSPRAPWESGQAGAGIRDNLLRLVGRDLFVDQVHALVDEADYSVSVADATRQRLREITADLYARQIMLDHLGVAPQHLAEETLRFYDSAFLDHPTIGGFL